MRKKTVIFRLFPFTHKCIEKNNVINDPELYNISITVTLQQNIFTSKVKVLKVYKCTYMSVLYFNT